jgi:hypothetical protein
MERVYKIKNSLRLPMALAIVLSIPVFYDVLTRGLPIGQVVLISILILFFYIMAINNILRRVIIRGNGIIIGNYLGKKEVKAEEVTALDGLAIGSRQFITIAVGKRNYLIQNSFKGFPEIIRDLEEIIPEERRGTGLEGIQETPLVRTGDTIAAWITVGILLAILVFKCMPG